MARKGSKKNSFRTTQAEVETRDPVIDNSPIQEPEVEPEAPEQEAPADLPKYRAGCPDCHERSLVTEQKIKQWRLCRCRECGWRGEMEE